MKARRLAPLLLFAASLLLASPVAGQREAPSFVVRAAPEAEWRPVVEAHGVLRDGALRDAMESGLPLRFRLRLELWRKGAFDRLAADEEIRFALLQDPLDRSYLLDTGRGERRYLTLADVEAALAGVLRPTLRPAGAGRFYYLGALEVETLSLSDLEELRRWLRGEVRPAVRGEAPPGRAVERGLRRLLVRVIGLPTRRYEFRTGTFTLR